MSLGDETTVIKIFNLPDYAKTTLEQCYNAKQNINKIKSPKSLVQYNCTFILKYCGDLPVRSLSQIVWLVPKMYKSRTVFRNSKREPGSKGFKIKATNNET